MVTQQRRPIVAGNWKMNTTLAEARALATALRASIGAVEAVDRVLCPPFISIAAVADVVRGSTIEVGAQNLHPAEKGAFTGEVSPTMLAPLCRYVVIGHSERRQLFGETDAGVNQKTRAALAHGLVPIVCVGETLTENEAGQTLDVIGRQVSGALDGIAATDALVLAYEPVWAIGTGRAATASGANDVIGAIRRLIEVLWGAAPAAQLRIQYGGSVTAANAAELFDRPEIDGALVGGASLKADDFTAIVRAAERAAG